MNNNDKDIHEQNAKQEQPSTEQNTVEQNSESQANQEPTEDLQVRIAELESQLEKEKKEYLFLMADFENYRRHTLQEKQELIRDGALKAMQNLLPVVDDFERAINSISTATDPEAVKEGINLIYNKFVKYLESNNVVEIASTGEEFNTDLHEAVTMFPATEPDQKGKVIDTVQKGYKINDKVLRHAKVVVAQ